MTCFLGQRCQFWCHSPGNRCFNPPAPHSWGGLGSWGDTPRPPPKGLRPLWNPHFHTSWCWWQPQHGGFLRNRLSAPLPPLLGGIMRRMGDTSFDGAHDRPIRLRRTGRKRPAPLLERIVAASLALALREHPFAPSQADAPRGIPELGNQVLSLWK
jgi:hypothetical protein